MAITRALLFSLFFINLNLTMFFYLHMYQLNSYQAVSHFNWIKSKWFKDIFLRNVWLFIPFVLCFVNNFVVLVTGTFVSYVIMFGVNRKRKYKKPLVYTNRLTRLLGTMGVINLVVTLAFMTYLNLWQACLDLTIWTFLLPFLIMLANLINSPIEKHINNGYIKDAKRILKDMPRLTVIGITGSYGKTSTKYFLNKLLSTRYNVLMTPGNFNTTLGVVRTVREKLNATHEIFLCEMGARHVGDIKEICDLVCPKYGIISSIGPQHLETFYNMENIINTKFELADAIPDDGKIFLNYGNEYIKNKKCKKNVVSYGVLVNGVMYLADNISVSAKGSIFTVTGKDGKKQEFRTKLIGRHNVENITGAIAIAVELGIPMEELVYAVKTLEAVPHRLELIKGKNSTIIDDAYNSNPVGAKMALDTLSCFDGTKIIITPGMVELGDKQDECNKEFGVNISKVCDYAVLVGKEQTKALYEGICEAKFDKDKVFVANSFDEGMEWIRELKCDKEKFVLMENDLPDNY